MNPEGYNDAIECDSLSNNLYLPILQIHPPSFSSSCHAPSHLMHNVNHCDLKGSNKNIDLPHLFKIFLLIISSTESDQLW
ncbi:hypothetical protein T11_10819 [Trichinella zimbabwensis]|uniref:Uncharacterized protein n=1 Tax=Trichinella zimbabwensis TaxID=268475 RepID=A0A0V1H5S1_9BILA|nr:hypothetical protein T11_10819 [Trichinella zimbabwensis]